VICDGDKWNMILDNKLGDIMIADNIDWRICKKKIK
jgi:hypothetical protein